MMRIFQDNLVTWHNEIMKNLVNVLNYSFDALNNIVYQGEVIAPIPSLEGLLESLHFGWVDDYNHFESDGYYICLTDSPKGHVQLYACWQDDGEVLCNTFDPFDKNPGIDRKILVSAIAYLVSERKEVDQFIKIG